MPALLIFDRIGADGEQQVAGPAPNQHIELADCLPVERPHQRQVLKRHEQAGVGPRPDLLAPRLRINAGRACTIHQLSRAATGVGDATVRTACDDCHVDAVEQDIEQIALLAQGLSRVPDPVSPKNE
ncbi:MAG TPA: hypothetical protein VNY35_10475 [Solirubrobacteraceae bacterium]|nr:hypothetical protein [Solirubrobacteraceae bacterium]